MASLHTCTYSISVHSCGILTQYTNPWVLIHSLDTGLKIFLPAIPAMLHIRYLNQGVAKLTGLRWGEEGQRRLDMHNPRKCKRKSGNRHWWSVCYLRPLLERITLSSYDHKQLILPYLRYQSPYHTPIMMFASDISSRVQTGCQKLESFCGQWTEALIHCAELLMHVDCFTKWQVMTHCGNIPPIKGQLDFKGSSYFPILHI